MAFLKRFRTLAAGAALVATAFVCSPSAQNDSSIEDEVKAAYLYNFTKYVSWPASAFSGTTDPLTLCVAGEPAVVKAVESIVTGEHVEGRPLRVLSQLPDGPLPCHVLFVGRGSGDRVEQLMRSAGTAPILTVGDSPQFLQQGGMIAFAVESRRVRFDIRIQPAERVGLKLSSKLLRVARHVDEVTQSR
jgi:hypothetical protein